MTTQRPDHRGAAGYGALLRNNRNFRYLWAGQVVSLLGDWFNLIASASLIAELSESGLAIGGLFVVRMLAQLLATPFAGVAADRYNRKRILIMTDITRAITVCGFLLVREPQHLWMLYALTAIQLGISGFFFPTRNAILPELVSPQELGAANAISSATWSVMLALGAALGGLAAGIWGNRPAFVIDAVSFVVSAVILAQISYRQPVDTASRDRTVAAALQQYLNGLRYLRKNSDILAIAFQKPAVALIISSPYQVMQVTVAEQVFVFGKGGGIGLGLIFGIVGVGTGIGPIIARYFAGDKNRSLRRSIIAGYLIAALGLLVGHSLSSFPVFLLGTLMRGVGVGIIWVFSTQLLLQLVPNQVRGRVFATEWAMFTLFSAAGAAIAGGAADTVDKIPDVLLVMSVVSLLPASLWTAWTIRISKPGSGDPGEMAWKETGSTATRETRESLGRSD